MLLYLDHGEINPYYIEMKIRDQMNEEDALPQGMDGALTTESVESTTTNDASIEARHDLLPDRSLENSRSSETMESEKESVSSPVEFVHLHCHTEYSLLEGAVRVSDLFKETQSRGLKHVAMTDNGTMYGSISFYLKAKSLGINPIVGCDMFIADDMHEKKRGTSKLVLLCKDFAGYQNLIKLVTFSHLDGFYYRPRIDLKLIREYSKGLIAISPGPYGAVGSLCGSYDKSQADVVASDLKEMFGDDFYLGIQRTDAPQEESINDALIDISSRLDIPLVVTNDVYYLKKEQAYLRNALNCIKTGRQLDGDPRASAEHSEQYFKTAEEMTALFTDLPQAIKNTVVIAEKCNFEIDTEQVLLPNFECPEPHTPETYLEELVWAGIDSKYKERTQEIKDRVSFEMSIINSMHYARYFLIIFDFLDYCVQQDIPVGPGRGSAAGSIVAYALNITKIDPIEYKLLFERFLNPERVSMPDIDLDFCIKRRGEVIDYIVEKYGNENVSQIITFGTMQARAVVRDVGRVLSVPLSDVDRLAKLIPATPGKYTSIQGSLDIVPDLKTSYDTSPSCKELLDIAMELEGFARHTSTHAAGVVISRDPLTTIVPLTKNEGQIITQYPMADIERVGLLKMDILGLRNLTVMYDSVKLIKKRHGIALDLDHLEVDDQKTYDLLCSGNTVGIFQLESKGMRALIKDLQPKVFEDIIALLALYRPGPLGSGMVQDFVSNKSGETEVQYDLPELEPVLKETYGMIVYQEQVMQIASTVGGFSLGQADMLRRAMGKKKKDVMDQMRDEFLKGASEKKFPAKIATKIFDLMYKFAEYGFNKSHSAAYALISFQTAYLKSNYPLEYMASLLSSVLGNTEKATLYITECKAMGIDVLPPCINESDYGFVVRGKAIRFGLGAIKNVGEGAIESIIESRDGNAYENLNDFCSKVNLKHVNKRVIESLIKCGGFDRLGDRGDYLDHFEASLNYAQNQAKLIASGQIGLFGKNDMAERAAAPSHNAIYLSPLKKFQMEKEVTGLYITGHPLESVKDELAKLTFNASTLTDVKAGTMVDVGGILENCREIITKTGKQMVLGTLTDTEGEITVMGFEGPKFADLKENFKDDSLVVVTGRAQKGNEGPVIRCEGIRFLDVSSVWLHIDINSIEDRAIFRNLRTLSKETSGNVPLVFHVDGKIIRVNRKYWVDSDKECVDKIKALVGSGHVWLGQET
ncbi:DNA polymerase III subunit alpha [bacterium]|jgi:DNA polymerase III subunit alpha|nr:DNA polymerase III subunit alpha [bacterium]